MNNNGENLNELIKDSSKRPSTLIQIMVNSLGKGRFLRQATVVGSGTVIGQMVLVGISPLLTRMFTPADFAVLAIFASIVSLVFIVATGRYELTILLPKKDAEAANLVVTSLILSLIVASLVVVATVFFGSTSLQYFGLTEQTWWIWFIAPTVAISSWRSTAMRWQTRKKRFSLLGVSSALGSTTTGLLQLIMGVLIFPTNGVILIIGNAVGRLVGFLLLLKSMFRDLWEARSEISILKAIEQGKKYWRFPVYLGPAGILSIAVDALPCLLIGAWFGIESLGFYALAERTVLMPGKMIGDSLGTVFFQRAAASKEDATRSKYLFRKLTLYLTLVAVFPATILFYFGSSIYGFIFGEQWTQSGHYVSILIFMAVAKFIVWPTRMLLQAIQSQRAALIWFITYIVLTCCALYYGKIMNDVNQAIIWYSSVSSAMYVLYWLISYCSVGAKKTVLSQVESNNVE